MTSPRPRLDDVYSAIADPTRRAILSALTRGDLTVGALASRFPISLNGVSKHVKVLERAGLVARHVDGREHWLRLEPAPLQSAAAWLGHYQAFWEARLDALESLLVDGEHGDAPSRRPAKRGRTRK